jgi:hypothetical protein
VGLLDALLGRTKPAQANLDRLFGLPGATITLEVTENLVSTGQAGVCFKAPDGTQFTAVQKELTDLLQLDTSDATPGTTDASPILIDEHVDEFGYSWIVIAGEDFDSLVTRTHFVNSTLQDNGYGPQLLCSVFGFGAKGTTAAAPASATTFLVYLYKRGTFYPFVPETGEHRNNEAELRLKNELSSELAIEPELNRWFPLWKLPFH